MNRVKEIEYDGHLFTTYMGYDLTRETYLCRHCNVVDCLYFYSCCRCNYNIWVCRHCGEIQTWYYYPEFSCNEAVLNKVLI